ncbi:MAG: hypothetical protein ABFC63_09190 [Thermoguttaceae bacterium]
MSACVTSRRRNLSVYCLILAAIAAVFCLGPSATGAGRDAGDKNSNDARGNRDDRRSADRDRAPARETERRDSSSRDRQAAPTGRERSSRDGASAKESRKQEAAPSTKRDTRPPTSRAIDRDQPSKGRQPAKSDRDTGRKPEADKKPSGVKPDAGRGDSKTVNRDKGRTPSRDLPKRDDRTVKGNDQPSAGDRTRIDDVRRRLDGPKPGKSGPESRVRGPAPRDPGQPRFSDRVKSGEIHRVTAGDSAKRLRLEEQYRLWQKGDVARRLEIQRHGPPPKPYRGVVSPAYQRHCFQYHYWGPRWFAGVYWYPTWNDWVNWSWHYRCGPHWDPRPAWCRPVFYPICPPWVYWATPVWTPLPVATCGTWVDLKPILTTTIQPDLELVAVRFVDPGHPEGRLGPRYRVWFRNNSSVRVVQPFSVMLFAANDERMAAGLPQAGVRVTSVEPGETQSVDVRLPFEVNSMNRDAAGNAAPFAVLHVLVDANREVSDRTRANNGARLAPADILPVDPAAFEADPVAPRAGGEVLVAGEGFGPQPGRVLVVVGGRELDATIVGWYDLGVRISVPQIAGAGAVDADLIVVRSDGAAANPLKITISP